MTALFAVAGEQVFHGKSPILFNEAFEALQLDAVCTRLSAKTAEEAIRLMRDIGIRGLDVAPHLKEDIMDHVDEVDSDARRIGAVNTVVAHEGGRLTGYNTDLAGFTGALRARNVTIQRKNAVVLGTDGTAKAAVASLLAGGASVTIADRTFNRARTVAVLSGFRVLPVEAVGDRIRDAHILISCIPSAELLFDPACLHSGLSILDAFDCASSILSEYGKSSDCTVIEGHERILHQALSAFTLFTGKKPPVAVMRRALYESPRKNRTNVSLIGFMGTGKSTVAAGLARYVGMMFHDIDSAIEEKTGSAIGDIFSGMGEKAFREMEKEEIGRIKSLSGAVIACGGGSVTSEENIRLLKEESIPVWLWAGPDTIMNRVGYGAGRPLLEGEEEGHAEKVKELLAQRLGMYARTAEIIVNTENRAPDEINERIWNEINKAVRN